MIVVSDVFSEIADVENLAAVYEELVSHLERIRDDPEMEIPVPGQDGPVPGQYIQRVINGLQSDRLRLSERKKEILNWPVTPKEIEDGTNAG